MSAIDEHITRLNDKLQLLLKKYQAIEKENEKLKQELQQKLLNEKMLQEKTALLQQQVEIANIASQKPDSITKSDLEKRINTYIREIDQCIALLSNQ
ncbi:MAG: hypothetical protein QM802_26855 [Agriterribacter sp.]